MKNRILQRREKYKKNNNIIKENDENEIDR